MARKQWRCFHCDELFTSERCAAEHFGTTQGTLAACQIKGHEHLLLRVIREQEAQLAQWRSESEPLTLAMEAMRAEHFEALRRAEEQGYDRGVQDMKAHGLRVA